MMRVVGFHCFSQIALFRSSILPITCLLLVVSFAYFFVSCESPHRTDSAYQVITFSDSDVPRTFRLQGHKFAFEELIFPTQLLKVDCLLVIGDRDVSQLIHVVDPGGGRYIRKMGKFGDGPGESGTISEFLTGHEKGTFWTRSGRAKQLSFYNIADTGKLSNKQIRQEGDFFLAVNTAWASDTSLLTTRADGDEQFVEYSLDGKFIRSWGSWRSLVDRSDLPVSVISAIHQGVLKASSDRSSFLFVCRNRDLIEFLQKGSGSIISIRGPENTMPKFTIDYSAGYPMPVLERHRKLFYQTGFIGRDFIYALYAGNYTTDISKRSVYNETIYVFNHRGAVQARLLLNYSVYDITVDEARGKIYGLTFDAEPNLVEFDLPLLNNLE